MKKKEILIPEKNLIKEIVYEHNNLLNLTMDKYIEDILLIVDIIFSSLLKGGTIFWCGNGGSASDSQHLAAELVGKYKVVRKPLKSISLTADTSVLTCVSNDFGYENLFSRQIEALGKNGDILIVLSTSGESKNIIKAVEAARNNDLITVGLLGGKRNKCRDMLDYPLSVPSLDTGRIQEIHIIVGHIICDLIEKKLINDY